MSRPLKFRVWDKRKNRFLISWKDEGLVFGYVDQENIEQFGGFPLSAFFEKNNGLDCIVQQFTGLLDRNNKEIYEGDLLQFAYREDGAVFTGEVKYSEKFACFIVVVENAFETFSDLAEHTHTLCVVGNRYSSISNL